MSSKDSPIFVQQGTEMMQEKRHGRPPGCIRRPDFKVEK
jgi:hypothetical protein